MLLDDPLKYAQIAGLAGMALELLSLIFRTKQARQLLYASLVIVIIPSTVLIVYEDFRSITVALALVAAFRVFNAFRVIEARSREIRMLHASRRTSLVLVLIQALTFAGWWLVKNYEVTVVESLMVLGSISLLVGLLTAKTAIKSLVRTAIRPSDKYNSDDELPTVSVCIPARNETEDLPKCLNSVLKSDYPKLEILVLDDCSQDKTSEIIKGFAQKGVRFIKGEEPKNGWLAKNQAYQSLSEAASGELILFMGVDVRLEKESIRSMVGTLIARKKLMLSILPRSIQPVEDASLIQPFRYWWEFALPRRLFNRPATLPIAWMINRQRLFALGEFKAVRRSVLPEGYFARETAKHDEYSFIRSSGKLSVVTAKSFAEQWDTAIRMRYPELKHRPENVLLVSIAAVWFLLLPLVIFFAGFIFSFGLLWVIGGLNSLLLFWIHYRITLAWHPNNQALPLLLLPVSVLLDLISLMVSMYRYEFDVVIWKDRNICIPVMQHTPRLPKA